MKVANSIRTEDLLAELIKRDIHPRIVKGRLVLNAPKGILAPETVDAIRPHKRQLLELLVLMDGQVPSLVVDFLTIFQDAELLGVRQSCSLLAQARQSMQLDDRQDLPARIQVARAIRRARRKSRDTAIVLLDAWRERIAICTADGVSEQDAQETALLEVLAILAMRRAGDLT